MDITKTDIMILVAMGLAVVGISFVFPAMGLSDTDTAENDIPELNISANTFDLAGESPEFPNTPTSGTLYFNTTQAAEFSDNSVWLAGDTSGGTELTLIQNATTDDAQAILTRWNSTGVAETDEAYISDTNPREVISVDGFSVAVEEGEDNNPPDYLQVTWKIAEGSESTGFLSNLFGGVGELVDVLAWLVIIFIWFSTTLVQFFLNAIVVIFDASSYFISLLAWLITTYGSVVTSAPSWTKIFVALPGIILSVTLGKLVVIFIGLLPTT